MASKASRPGNWPARILLGAAAGLWLVISSHSVRAADADLQCGPGHPRIEVTVEGLRSERGDVVVELYPDDAKGFLSSKVRLGRSRAKAAPGAQVCIPAPAPGFYAVVVYHDENGDRHFSKNFLGLPSEGFGVSNNPPPGLGKPSFRAVRFEVGEGTTELHVRVRYGLGGGSD